MKNPFSIEAPDNVENTAVACLIILLVVAFILLCVFFTEVMVLLVFVVLLLYVFIKLALPFLKDLYELVKYVFFTK